MDEAVIIDAVRTPVGGARPGVPCTAPHPVQLHARVLREPVARTAIDPAGIGDVISGAVTQVGEQGSNTAT